MKKWLLGLGSMGAIVAPIVTVVACDDDDDDEEDFTVSASGTTVEVEVTNSPVNGDDVVNAIMELDDFADFAEVKVTINGIDGTGTPATKDAAGFKAAITAALAADSSLANCIEL